MLSNKDKKMFNTVCNLATIISKEYLDLLEDIKKNQYQCNYSDMHLAINEHIKLVSDFKEQLKLLGFDYNK